MPGGAVAGSWARIVATLTERAPASARWINGPADAGMLERLRREIGLPLPRTWRSGCRWPTGPRGGWTP